MATQLLASTLRVSTPLIFAALGGLMSERSGVINIALEGLMLIGAFGAAVGNSGHAFTLDRLRARIGRRRCAGCNLWTVRDSAARQPDRGGRSHQHAGAGPDPIPVQSFVRCHRFDSRDPDC